MADIIGSVSVTGGGRRDVVPTVTVDSNGNPTGGNVYILAGPNATLTAGSPGTTVTGVAGGYIVWAYQFTGTAPSLVLESLGPDGTNWQTVATVSASGTTAIYFGANSSVRVRNAGANSITALSSSLS